MSYGQLWRELARRGWGIEIKTAHFLGEESQPTIGVQVVLDRKDGELLGEVVHHEALIDDDAVLDAATRLCQQAVSPPPL